MLKQAINILIVESKYTPGIGITEKTIKLTCKISQLTSEKTDIFYCDWKDVNSDLEYYNDVAIESKNATVTMNAPKHVIDALERNVKECLIVKLLPSHRMEKYKICSDIQVIKNKITFKVKRVNNCANG